VNCSGCGHENRDSAKFCEECATPLLRSCASCGTELRPGARFCDECAHPVGSPAPKPATDASRLRASAGPERSPLDYTPKHLAERILRSKSALEGERKQVTVMFADVPRSMELAEELDPEAWHAVLDRFFQLLAEGVHRFEGTINQYTGDGIMALFGAPVAHEDHAHRACFAALHLRDQIREYAKEVRTRYGVSFGVRIGLNSGDVVVGKIGDDLRMDYTAQGQVVGLAQRMEALAESGSIHLSEHTAHIVEGYFELQDQGAVAVKGVSQPVGLFELVGVGRFRTRLDRSRARGFSMFVGRDQEMNVLEAALEDARAGRARIVGVVADAGVGKSRLCAEFVERCRAREITVLEAHCPAHGRTIPLLPVLELLRGYFGIEDGDAARIAREKIAGRLLLLNRDLDAYLPLVWDLMRVPDPERPVDEQDPAVRQRRLGEVIQSVVRLRSEREPAVFLIDDLHWVDTASDDFIARLVEAVHDTRTLIVANFRPEYRAEWMRRSDYLQLPLSPLGPDAIQTLLATLLGDDPSVAALPDAIHARAAGNPFFTEEVVQSLIESGQLEGERGAFRLVGPVDRVEIPDTVQAVLAARIDRLADLEKRVLQTAAVIDKDFARPLLGEIADLPEAELDESLRALCDADLLYQRELYPVVEYAFKHPLTHEVAYVSQLSERRRKLHASLARVLESAEDPQAALLAHHWDEAGESEPAVRWHRKAAEELGFLALPEMLRHWRRVAELADQLPSTPENLATAATARAQILWVALRTRVEPEEAETLYSEALALAQRAGDRAALAGVHRVYATYRLYSGQSSAEKLAEEAVREADESGDLGMRIATRFAASVAHFYGADPRLGLQRSEEVLALTGDDLERGEDLVGFSPRLHQQGLNAAFLANVRGDLDEARKRLAWGLSRDHEKHAASIHIVRGFCVVVAERMEDGVWALAEGERAAGDWQRQFGETLQTGNVFVLHNLGVAQALSGRWDEALASLDHSLEQAREARTFVQQTPVTLAWKARVLLAKGQSQAVAAVLEEAIDFARKLEQTLPLADALLLRARWRGGLEPQDLERSESDVDEAAAIVERCGFRGYEPDVHEARAALARLRGDESGWRRELEQARDLARAMGAGPRADRIAAALAEHASPA
jgi:class 3 adenylate cyclase/tetratricopeptide (TPR) repeat protein